MVKNLSADARDVGLIPGLGRSLGGGNGNPLQYSCLEKSMDREAWWAIVLGVTKSQTCLMQLSMHTWDTAVSEIHHYLFNHSLFVNILVPSNFSMTQKYFR